LLNLFFGSTQGATFRLRAHVFEFFQLFELPKNFQGPC